MPNFLQIQDLITRANLFKNIYPTTIKNDNGAVGMRFFVQRERNQQLHQI